MRTYKRIFGTAGILCTALMMIYSPNAFAQDDASTASDATDKKKNDEKRANDRMSYFTTCETDQKVVKRRVERDAKRKWRGIIMKRLRAADRGKGTYASFFDYNTLQRASVRR